MPVVELEFIGARGVSVKQCLLRMGGPYAAPDIWSARL